MYKVFHMAAYLEIFSLLCKPTASYVQSSTTHHADPGAYLHVHSRGYRAALKPMLVWILVFFTRAHKVRGCLLAGQGCVSGASCFIFQEERFLFPIYPLFCLCAAITVYLLPVSHCLSEFVLSLILYIAFCTKMTCSKIF